MDLVLVTGAGASRELGATGPMPLMADWSTHLIDRLDAQIPGLARSMGLTPGLDGEHFEEALGAWLKWRAMRDLQQRFGSFGGPEPNSVNGEVTGHRHREDQRIELVVRILNETLYELFGREAIDDNAAQQAYRVLLAGLTFKSLVCVTTNYDVALEIGVVGIGRGPYTGFDPPSYGATPVFNPAGMVNRAREGGSVAVIHLHGKVGWYADNSKVYDMNADRPHNATLGTPVVLYPDPEKQPTRDVLVADLWTEFTDAAQAATHILVVGHSLHDPSLVAELKRSGAKVGVVVYDGLKHEQVTREVQRVRDLLPKAHVVPGTFGTSPQFSGIEYDAWMKGAQPIFPAYIRT
ncbi:MAG TPA: hypothetical protein VK501_17070 [Baekduia sp.]|uniref:hypothetical protein n=1 Tax=Baekduia sp. TaxID=2600305 RepID=UPI002C93200E|nr:hypothetical protein [Baekduia sp.]HMJ35624.1 hypothetical protein [Baekduia sp.]